MHGSVRSNLSEIQQEQAVFRATVKELRVADKYCGGYRRCGRGELTLAQTGLTFCGEIDGRAAELFSPIAHVRLFLRIWL